MFKISKKYCCRKMDGNKIFDVSELFRCYFIFFFDLFRCIFSMFSLSMFCLFHVFAFLCFVVLCFVIDPLNCLFNNSQLLLYISFKMKCTITAVNYCEKLQ